MRGWCIFIAATWLLVAGAAAAQDVTLTRTLTQGSTASVTLEGVSAAALGTLQVAAASLAQDDAGIAWQVADFDATRARARLLLQVGAAVEPGSHTLEIALPGASGRRIAVRLEVQASGAAPAGGGIVYVRVPRAHELIIGGTNMGILAGQELEPSFTQVLPEVNFIRAGFSAPGQLVWRREDGSQTIIYDCVTGAELEKNGDPVCVPMDPVVSWDGSRLLFAVYHGAWVIENQGEASYMGGYQYNRQVGNMQVLTGTEAWAEIFSYDFNTGELNSWGHEDRVWDTAPVWLPNGQVMFTSTRGNMISQVVRGGRSTSLVQQLWIANADGTDAHPVGMHDQQDVLHPFVHSSGRVFYSKLAYNQFRRDGETQMNQWWMGSIDRRGGDFNAHLRAHAYKQVPIDDKARLGHVRWNGHAWEFHVVYTYTAPHFFGERSNGDICSDIYYRANNFGAGHILCWPTSGQTHAPLGHEGSYPFGFPDGAYIAVMGDAGDAGSAASNWHVRDPAGMPGGQLLFSGAVGPHSNCHFVTHRPSYLPLTEGGYTCDFGIYITRAIPTRDLRNAIPVVDDPEWMEFMPKPVMSYAAIHGIPHPAEPPLNNIDASDQANGYAVFGSATAFVGNVLAAGGWKGPGSNSWCRLQGCALHGVPLTEIQSIRFWRALPNDRYWGKDAEPINNPRTLYNFLGQKMELMGDVAVQTDGSFKAKIPADTPFLMAGVDADGNSIARDQHLFSLRPGEKMTCTGCHLHDATVLDFPEPDFAASIAAALPAVAPQAELQLQDVLEWKADIQPLLAAKCSSCHNAGSGQQPDFSADELTLYDELTRALRYPGSGQLADDGTTRLRLPWYTRYVNGFFARESLLYWKAYGARRDGRSDGDRDDDIDFGPAHARHLSPAELRLLATWIESGAHRDACDPALPPSNIGSCAFLPLTAMGRGGE